jgi:glycosyltransferase involved in cell wall biosynthesis
VQPDVSVIIPTHNRAHVLERALDSVLAQTRVPTEIIVVDDGSSDDTAVLLRSRYPWIRSLYQPNRGVSAARNRGIMAARSEWLAFLDSDDEWLPHKLEHQFAMLRPHHRISHTDEIWIRRGKRVNPMKKHAKAGGWIYRHCLPLCAISPSAVLIHRSVFGQVGLFDETLPACEDYDLWLRLCCRYPVHYLDQPLIIKYGGHDDQLSQRYWGMDRFRIRALEKILAGNRLKLQDRQATLQVLIDKLNVYANGAGKRGKSAEAADCRAKRDRYAQQLNEIRQNVL